MSSGTFISLEGIDKTGKTLLWEILKTNLPDGEFVQDPTILQPWNHVFTNGPDLHRMDNSTILQEQVFEVLFEEDKEVEDVINEPPPGIVTSLLFFAARHHCYQQKIRPALQNGDPVISDRFSDSWIAYQSVFQEEHFPSIEEATKYFQSMHDLAVEYELLTTPDLTILITTDRDTLTSRLNQTETLSEYETDPEKLLRVQGRYEELAEQTPSRFRIIEDEGQGITAVYEQVEEILTTEDVMA